MASTTQSQQNQTPRLDWWRAARFGLFIHWGPVSLVGTEIGWSRGGERRGFDRGGTGDVPIDVYDNLYKEFNPTLFNAAEWVQIARDTGMGYMVFTSKHHDGFVNFDTALTDYKITSPESPFGRDIVRELADAAHAADLPFGCYYSQPDWRHPDYRNENHHKYIDYFHAQVAELCSNYGELAVLWFDGLQEHFIHAEEVERFRDVEVFPSASIWESERLFQKIRELQPNILINNRCGMRADFDTPEQMIGAFQNQRPWESCITICKQWSWKPDDILKSFEECIHTLARVVGGDGNLLLNVGPMPDGRIEPRQVERLREIGDWLGHYGESIYGTRGGPFRPGAWGAATHKGEDIYLHILAWPEDKLTLAPLAQKIVSAVSMTGGEVALTQSDDAITLSIAPEDRNPVNTLVRLTVAN